MKQSRQSRICLWLWRLAMGGSAPKAPIRIIELEKADVQIATSMARKTQHVISPQHCLIARRANIRPLISASWRTNGTDTRNFSHLLPEQQFHRLSHVSFQSTVSVRKAGEPASPVRAQSIYLRRSKPEYTPFPPLQKSDQRISESYLEASVEYNGPRQRSRRVVNLRSVNTDALPEAHCVPPIRSVKAWSSPSYSRNVSSEPPNHSYIQLRSILPYQDLMSNFKPRKRLLTPIQRQRSDFSTSPTFLNPIPSPSPELIDIDQYHRLADSYIDNLVTKLEAIQEERDEVDCEYTVRTFLSASITSSILINLITNSLAAP